MKALKTIVATAVIVFALTTVAVAGVERLSGGGNAATSAAAAPPAAAPQAPAQATVTLSAQQFAQLLRAARGGTARRQALHRDRDRSRTHTHATSGGSHQNDASHDATTSAHAGSGSGSSTAHSFDDQHPASTGGSACDPGSDHDGGCE